MKTKIYRFAVGGLAVTTVMTQFLPPISAYAATSGEILAFRSNVIRLCGIMDTSGDTDSTVTRGQFAEFLVKASSYKDSTAQSSIAAANDVPASNAYAPYIRIALQQGWMRTYLGGQFRPDEPVKLQDATKAVLTLLGYSDSDFTGDLAQSRLSTFKSLDLNKQMSSSNLTDTLTRKDCIHIFYNLLKTKSKGSSSIYGTLFELTLASDGEIDPNELVESNTTGPILVRSLSELAEAVPFDVQTANLYFNGSTSRYMSYDSSIRQNGWLVVYYNEDNHTIWAYGQDNDNGQYHVVKGQITKIYYEASNVVTPSSIVLDDNYSYALGSSEVKFMLGINGDIKLDDEVILVCQVNTDEDDNEDYSVIGVIKYRRDTDGSTIGTSNVIYAGSAAPGTTTTSVGTSASASGPGTSSGS